MQTVSLSIYNQASFSFFSTQAPPNALALQLTPRPDQAALPLRSTTRPYQTRSPSGLQPGPTRQRFSFDLLQASFGYCFHPGPTKRTRLLATTRPHQAVLLLLPIIRPYQTHSPSGLQNRPHQTALLL